MIRKFLNLKFGVINVEELFKAIFILGLIPIIIINIHTIALNGGNMTFSHLTAVTFIYILILLLFFTLLSVAVWKIVCELLFLVFKSLEVFIHRNDE